MDKTPRANPLHRCLCACCDDGSHADGTSRRGFLATGAALAAAATAAPMLSTPARAQASDPELTRLQAQRRILIKGGVVLTLDRQVGDFAQADVLIDGKKILAVQPNIQGGGAQVIDARGKIVMPGFVDTHHHQFETVLRSFLADGILINDGSGSLSASRT